MDAVGGRIVFILPRTSYHELMTDVNDYLERVCRPTPNLNSLTKRHSSITLK